MDGDSFLFRPLLNLKRNALIVRSFLDSKTDGNRDDHDNGNYLIIMFLGHHDCDVDGDDNNDEYHDDDHDGDDDDDDDLVMIMMMMMMVMMMVMVMISELYICACHDEYHHTDHHQMLKLITLSDDVVLLSGSWICLVGEFLGSQWEIRYLGNR